MKSLTRRTVLKAAAGLVAFIPVVRELAQAPPAAADCGCADPPPFAGPPPPGYQLCEAVRVVVDEEYCLQNEDGSWTIYRDQKLLDAFYYVDCSDGWYLFNTGIRYSASQVSRNSRNPACLSPERYREAVPLMDKDSRSRATYF